jgi:ABC-type multidrug transport system ATPase subunit
MKNSDILLMDEVTASLDSQSANQILHAMDQWPGQRTRLMISHKLSEIKDADVIIVLEDGKVLAQGHHEELLQTCRLYQQLWTANHLQQDEDKGESLSSPAKMVQGLGGSLNGYGLEHSLDFVQPCEPAEVQLEPKEVSEEVYEAARYVALTS